VAGPSSPVPDDVLDRLFAPLSGETALAVAVSGGPDSTGLLVLLDRWARRRGSPRLHVFTVDHGLRPESADDASAVETLAARLDRPATVLRWHHPDGPPAGDLQAAARNARYALLADAAFDHGCGAVALGHTLDDKAETFLIRLARGSGLTGLAAMPAERRIGGVRFVRPLLGLRKADLEATLRAAGIGWRVDPSNHDVDRFLRARMRAALPALADLGLTVERLASTADRLALASSALDGLAAEFAAVHVVDHGGVVSVDRAALAAAAPEIAFRVLADASRRVRPDRYPPRAEALTGVLAAIAGPAPRRKTAGGLVFHPSRGRVFVHAEAGRAGFPTLRIVDAGVYDWDGRVAVIVGSRPPSPLLVRPARGRERRADLPPPVAGSLPVAVDEATGERATGVRFDLPGARPDVRSTSSEDRRGSDPCPGWQSAVPDLHSDDVRSRGGVLHGVAPEPPKGQARISKV
jgi:tRNA(Ile)-lysidine synthase